VTERAKEHLISMSHALSLSRNNGIGAVVGRSCLGDQSGADLLMDIAPTEDALENKDAGG
jgi:hypothetical protein